jgi:hypothetical protein
MKTQILLPAMFLTANAIAFGNEPQNPQIMTADFALGQVLIEAIPVAPKTTGKLNNLGYSV